MSATLATLATIDTVDTVIETTEVQAQTFMERITGYRDRAYDFIVQVQQLNKNERIVLISKYAAVAFGALAIMAFFVNGLTMLGLGVAFIATIIELYTPDYSINTYYTAAGSLAFSALSFFVNHMAAFYIIIGVVSAYNCYHYSREVAAERQAD